MNLLNLTPFRLYLINKIKLYIAKKGKMICDKQLVDHQIAYVMNIIENIDNTNSNIDSIVFSKDRAMQLHAFLKSYIENVSNRGKMYVLYNASNQQHKKSYDQLKELLIDEEIYFINELNFREQLIDILENSIAGKIIYYVDDMIFTHKVCYKSASKIDTSKYILTLSRGNDLTYSVVLEKPLSIPKFQSKVEGYNCFNWNEIDEHCDWSFPLGISGYMFGRKEAVAMVKSIHFKAPNSLERAMQSIKPFFVNRHGLCPDQAACVCVHANLVQTEGHSPVLGTFSINELLEMWETGRMIDLKEFYGKPMNITQMLKYTFVDRTI